MQLAALPPLRTTIAALVLVVGACKDDAPSGEGTEGGTSSSSTEGGTIATGSSSESSSSSSESGVDSSSTGEPFVPIDCTESCVDTTSDAGVMLCYSCRCKAAFDNWLPTRDEVQCSTATEIVTYHADLSTPDVVLEPAPVDASTCANPSLLTSSCRQGSKLGQLQNGDVMLRWICRDPYVDDDGTVVYEDMGLIGQNVRTGATCFWDDIDNVTHEDDMPPLDLMEATDDERAEFGEVFYFVDGSGTCKDCHDHDPFVYTPYLQSTEWITVSANKGPYSFVNLNGTGKATGNKHLVSPQANACLACHRMGSENTCAMFAQDSLAAHKGTAYEQEVLDAAEPGSPHWKLAYWMPSAALPIPDYATWLTTFETAREHILECCNSPGQDIGDCKWQPVPAE